jgi:hypothetical protein
MLSGISCSIDDNDPLISEAKLEDRTVVLLIPARPELSIAIPRVARRVDEDGHQMAVLLEFLELPRPLHRRRQRVLRVADQKGKANIARLRPLTL